jgi:hypothetical protein
MKKYIVLYQAPGPAMEQMSKMTPEQSKAGMDAWMGWAQKTGSALVDLGSPLGVKKSVGKGGAVSNSTSTVCGFSVLQAASLDAATKFLEGHPHLQVPGASIEVIEYLPLPGM